MHLVADDAMKVEKPLDVPGFEVHQCHDSLVRVRVSRVEIFHLVAVLEKLVEESLDLFVCADDVLVVLVTGVEDRYTGALAPIEEVSPSMDHGENLLDRKSLQQRVENAGADSARVVLEDPLVLLVLEEPAFELTLRNHGLQHVVAVGAGDHQERIVVAGTWNLER